MATSPPPPVTLDLVWQGDLFTVGTHSSGDTCEIGRGLDG